MGASGEAGQEIKHVVKPLPSGIASFTPKVFVKKIHSKFRQTEKNPLQALQSQVEPILVTDDK